MPAHPRAQRLHPPPRRPHLHPGGDLPAAGDAAPPPRGLVLTRGLSPPPLFTLGHSNRSAAELVACLRGFGVRRLFDIRTVPRSRRNPQFNRERLPELLRPEGIAYRHLPALGGLRRPAPDSSNRAWRNASFRGFADYMQTRTFEEAVERLVEEAARGGVVLLCAEAVPWRCHRSLVADALTARGVPVEHIMTETVARTHVLTPWAHLEGGRVTYPAGRRSAGH